jgi:hypothetical protein
MPDPLIMAGATVLAALVAVVVWLVGRSRPAAGAVGVGLGVLVGAWVLGLGPRVPPREVLDRFLLILVPAAMLAEVASSFRARWVGWVARAVVALGAAPVLVYQGPMYLSDLTGGPTSGQLDTTGRLAVFAGLAVALFLVWAALNRLADRAGRSATVAMAVTTGGAGLALMLSGYATGGLLGFPLAVVVGVFAFIGSGHRPSAVGVAVVALFALLVIGRLFAGLTPQSALLLFAAPLLAWLPELPRVRRLRPLLRDGLRVALTIVPVVLTLWLAHQKFVADSAPGKPGEATADDYSGFMK